jgi:hypothetical protein
VGKKSSKSRRRDQEPAIDAVQPSAAVEGGPGIPEQAAKLESADETPRNRPLVSSLSAEALAAHDSFVRSPAAVVESLGIRVTPAVAKRLASTLPPPPDVEIRSYLGSRSARASAAQEQERA